MERLLHSLHRLEFKVSVELGCKLPRRTAQASALQLSASGLIPSRVPGNDEAGVDFAPHSDAATDGG